MGDSLDKRQARMAHWERITKETIKKHLARPHVCCLDKYKPEDLPKGFKQCADCKVVIDLDTREQIC